LKVNREEQKRLASRRYRAKHPEKIRLYNKQYREHNRRSVLLGKLRWFYEHHDHAINKGQEWKCNNRARWIAGAIRWAKENPEQYKVNQRRSYQRHRKQRIETVGLYKRFGTSKVSTELRLIFKLRNKLGILLKGERNEQYHGYGGIKVYLDRND